MSQRATILVECKASRRIQQAFPQRCVRLGKCRLCVDRKWILARHPVYLPMLPTRNLQDENVVIIPMKIEAVRGAPACICVYLNADTEQGLQRLWQRQLQDCAIHLLHREQASRPREFTSRSLNARERSADSACDDLSDSSETNWWARAGLRVSAAIEDDPDDAVPEWFKTGQGRSSENLPGTPGTCRKFCPQHVLRNSPGSNGVSRPEVMRRHRGMD